MIKMRIEGLEQLKNVFKDFNKEINESVSQDVQESAVIMTNKARSNCRFDSIRSTIKSSKESKSRAVVTTDGVISAYLEFGTGNFAKAQTAGMHEDWRTMAMSFYVSGNGRVPAFPYMYPAFTDTKKELLNKINNRF